jgi:hypothetical protein
MWCTKKLFLLTIAIGWIGSGSVKSGYKSEDPDMKKIFTDPEHWFLYGKSIRIVLKNNKVKTE